MDSPRKRNTIECMEEELFFCIRQIYGHVLPEKQTLKSIHDLFNSSTYHSFLVAIISQQKIPSESLQLKKGNSKQAEQRSEEEEKYLNFIQIREIIQEFYDGLGESFRVENISDSEVEDMVKNYNLTVLKKFIEHTLRLVIYNPNILEFITSLSEEMQSDIKDLLENPTAAESQNSISATNLTQGDHSSLEEVNSLKLISKLTERNFENGAHIEHLEEIESHLLEKEDELKDLKQEKLHLEEEIKYIQQENSSQLEEIESYKQRLQSYQEIDLLMQEKDEEISKITKRLTELELKFRLKENELKGETKKFSEKVSAMEHQNGSLNSQLEKLKGNVEQVKRQKQDSENSMRKVISNLKEKSAALNEKINELQKELIEANFQKEVKEKELEEAKLVIQSYLKSSKSNGEGEQFDKIILNSPRSPTLPENVNQPREPGAMSFLDNSSVIYNNQGQNYSKLGEQLGEFINCSTLPLQKTQFQEQMALYSQNNQNSNKRFGQLLRENHHMRQQLQVAQMQMSSVGTANHNTSLINQEVLEANQKQIKELKDEIQKMKGKNKILKRRNDEIDQQRKDQIDLIVGVIESYHSENVSAIKSV